MRALLLLLALAACMNDGAPVPTSTANGRDSFDVVRLFTMQGCTVFRFTDGGHSHYFTTCAGSVQSEHTEGKVTRHEEISTEARQ